MPTDLSQYAAVLLDLDGTIYHEDHALPGAIDLLRRLQSDQRVFACLSNSTTSPARIAARVAHMGVTLDPATIYTAAAATADYVLATFGQSRRPRVFNLATDGMAELLDGRVDWVNSPGEPCDVVVAGALSNTYATEERSRFALAQLRRGAALVGICADRVYPSPRGLEFGSGAFTQMLAYASNAKPVFCGKPNALFFQVLCERLRVSPAACLLVGDNVEADVIGAKALGMKTVLVLTGVTRRRDLIGQPATSQPDAIIEDLTEL